MEASPLISTQELAALLASRSPVHIVDGSMFPGEDSKSKYQESHIPTAIFFDQEFIRSKSSSHSLAVLSAASFAEHMKALGLPNDGSRIVVYDQYSLISAARVWFLLRFYGYADVKFLDGGLPKWLQERRPAESGPSAPGPADPDPELYQLTTHPEMVAYLDEVKAAVAAQQRGSEGPVIWDPRNPAKSGATIVPGSVGVFYRDALELDGTFKKPQVVREQLGKRGVDLSRPVITSCNRGVVSSAGYLILFYIGKSDMKNYLGSWIEWKAKVVDAEGQSGAIS